MNACTETINMKILVIVLAVTTVIAKPATNDCMIEFQSQLNHTLQTKESCGIEGFYDCCEVSHTDKVEDLIHLGPLPAFQGITLNCWEKVWEQMLHMVNSCYLQTE